MQLRPKEPLPAVVDLDVGESMTGTELNMQMNTFLRSLRRLDPDSLGAGGANQNGWNGLLSWEKKTQLSPGFAKTLAWHLDLIDPFGPPRVRPPAKSQGQSNTESNKAVSLSTEKHLGLGDTFRKHMGMDTCSRNDLLCHRGDDYLPCLSECSSHEQCESSVFDSVLNVTQSVSLDCDVVLYTQSLGYDVHGMKLKATFSEEGDVIICNIAFLPRESRLVNAVIKSVPETKLSEYGIPPRDSMDPQMRMNLIKDSLNGLLLYKGWFLVWVPDADEPPSQADKFMLKLAPGGIFSSDVKYALFVDENFGESPEPDDIMFLASQMHRDPLDRRSKYKKLETGKKKKFVIPAEPERQAVLLLSPMRTTTSIREGEKLTTLKATKIMLVENGADEDDPKETPELKRQREFYERIPGFVNRMDMRSPLEPWYRYDMKHWVRSRWIVHNLRPEEGRQLRCEWYQEQVQWGNELDQLSFAHVMARREIERRMAHQEPDDHFKPAFVQHPELVDFSDAHEWFPMDNQLDPAFLNGDDFQSVPSHMHDHEENAKKTEKENEDGNTNEDKTTTTTKKKSGPPLFVRIVSERIMTYSRSQWERYRAILVKSIV